MPQKIFTARLENLSQIGSYIIQAAQKAGLDEDACYAVELAVDEAATNIIEHGYKGDSSGIIACAYEIMNDGIRIVLKDHGRQFDPESVPEPSFHGVSLEEVTPRGLGLYFIRKLMDEVKFEFSSRRGNKLTLVKRKTH